MLRLWGSRRSGWPFRNASSTWERMASWSRSRSRAAARPSSAIPSRQISAARPKPTMRGTGKRARAHPSLVAAAVDQRGDPHARALAAHVEGADALGAVHQVRGARQEIDAHALDIDRDLAGSLGGVGVEDDPLLLGQLADGRDVLDRPDLVVGEHDGDQDRLVGDRLANLVHGHESVRLRRARRSPRFHAAPDAGTRRGPRAARWPW